MIILINDSLAGLDIEASLPLLPLWRREKALRYFIDSDRRQSIAAWLLLRQACIDNLSLKEVPEIAFQEHGKPFFPSLQDVHFNLSHCREAVICAVDNKPVGVDIECLHPLDEAVMRQVFNEDECDRIKTSDCPETEFSILWTKKESLLKLTGEGLCDDMRPLLKERKGIRIETAVDPKGKYVYSVASPSG